MLNNKHILLGITGGIAAYKCPELIRLLTKTGAEVRVVLTQSAIDFVAPKTLEILSHHPVYQALDNMAHIELARWADLILIAPATANIIAKLAHGFADDLLSTLCVATTAPIMIAPAMNQQMWANIATQENIKILLNRGFCILGPAEGIQACGETGLGRLLEPEEILAQLSHPPILKNKTVIVTAGPTREDIDPVRYISNHSSGKMGYAIAEAARQAGANVILISGPTVLETHPHIHKINTVTTQDMYKSVFEHIEQCDIFISAAAVSDYRIKKISPQKIKKTADSLSLDLVLNPDILKDMAKLKKRPIIIGFAAETESILENAKNKLNNKKLDMIVANKVGDGLGFNSDDNQVSIITHRNTYHIEKAKKTKIARQLIEIIQENFFHEKN